VQLFVEESKVKLAEYERKLAAGEIDAECRAAARQLREAYPNNDNHLCGFITPWGATHRMVKTETGEWTVVRNEPVNAGDRWKIDRWLAQRTGGNTRNRK
jgi:hypothetical protein